MSCYQPQTSFQRFLARHSSPRGYFGRSFGRKLKRRYQRRADIDFAAAVADLQPGDLVFDFGANIGKFSRIMGITGAEVHAFEPDPETCDTLRKNVADLPNIIVHQQAVGAHAGHATLRRVPDFEEDKLINSQASSIVYTNERMQGGDTFQVGVVSFWDLLAKHRVPKIIKMDIEGAELDILESLFAQETLPELGQVFVETHENLDWNHWPQVLAFRKQARDMQDTYINLYWR